jgi:hypothetical protein
MWSIGLYSGDSPFCLAARPGIVNPVLTRESVTDVPAKFVADPFLVKRNGTWFMFFEVLNRQTGRGQIALATSDNTEDWIYQKIILAEPFHLSYPYVFQWNDEHYMIPESFWHGTVRLYKADDFPMRWSFVRSLIRARCADPSVFYFDDQWWMFICSNPSRNDALRLYFANDLLGPWLEHPASPIVKNDARKARPAGRVLVLADKIFRFAQDCVPNYGTQVRAFEISELTTTSYVETENSNSPILTASGVGWNESGMHHVDPHLLPGGQWLACVDGINSIE